MTIFTHKNHLVFLYPAGSAEGEAQRVLAVVDDHEEAGDGPEDVE